MKRILFLTAFAFSVNSFASTNKIKIVQVMKNQHIIMAQGGAESSAIGKTYLVNFQDDTQCSVVLQNIQGTVLTFSSSSCDREGQLKKNLEIELALLEPAPPVIAEKKSETEQSSQRKIRSDREFRFGITAHFNSAQELKFTETVGNDVTFNTSGAFGLGVRGAILSESSWGFIGSLEHEFKRTIDSFTGINGSTLFSQKPGLSFFLVEAMAAYRWGFFYLPFGLNYSIPELSNSDGEKVKGTVGGVFGAGFFVSPDASLEILVRAVGVRFEDSATDDILGTGFLGGLVLKGNYWF